MTISSCTLTLANSIVAPTGQKKKPPAESRYDTSLSPTLAFDGQNGARGLGEWLLAKIDEASGLPGTKFEAAQEFRDATLTPDLSGLMPGTLEVLVMHDGAPLARTEWPLGSGCARATTLSPLTPRPRTRTSASSSFGSERSPWAWF